MSMAFHTYNENCNYSEGSVNDICGKIFIDIDGPDNGGATFAQDRFEFNVTANGIMPAGLGENPNRNNCFARGQHCESYMLEHCKTKK